MGSPSLILDCSALPEADATQLDGLARLVLGLRRRRCQIRLANPGEGLLDLIEFAGLGEVLRVEPGWEAPEREEARGVEEEGQLGDPAP
jgi:hypothetical protein